MNIAINGFGRIGRQALRIIEQSHPSLRVVLINDLTDPQTLAHLLTFDSTYGIYDRDAIYVEGDILVTGHQRIRITALKDPSELPHKAEKVDIVLECTGRFTDRAGASLHLQAGAKKVILSAPAKDTVDGTFVLGVNEETYDPTTMHVVSNASCTTNCLAPMAKVLNDAFGIEHGLMTTIHSYTNDQNLLDLPHKDLRRARAAAVNIVPSSTGAAKAIGLVIPELDGKMHGIALRVPTPTGSMTDLTVVTRKTVTRDSVNAAFRAAAESKRYRGILRLEERELVLKDFVGDPYSCIIDAPLTNVMVGNLVKVFGWYDNELAYSHRLVELAAFMGEKL